MQLFLDDVDDSPINLNPKNIDRDLTYVPIIC